MNTIACIAVGIIANVERGVKGRDHGVLKSLFVGSAMISGFLFNTLMGFPYALGFNLAISMVSAAGAIKLLALVGGTRSRIWS